MEWGEEVRQNAREGKISSAIKELCLDFQGLRACWKFLVAEPFLS